MEKPPSHHPSRLVDRKDPQFYNEKEVITELRRIFDICHTCRRCFNLCQLFPKLFDALDRPEIDGDIEKLSDQEIKALIPECTLCDLCYMIKCPYVPPHPWKVDLPRTLLRWRAIESKKKFSWQKWKDKRLARMDQVGTLGSCTSSLSNKAMECSCLRNIGQTLTGISAKAHMPPFRSGALTKTWQTPEPKKEGPFFGQQVWLYASCFNNYYESTLAQDAAKVLAHWGINVQLIYPGCCGMPLWEQGDLDGVEKQINKISHLLDAVPGPLIPLTPSCSFMLRSEWPSLCPENPQVISLSQKTIDLCEYILSLLRSLNPQTPLTLPLPSLSVHMACHVRAQNKGNNAYTLLKRLSSNKVNLIEQCSGHGGLWGYKEEHLPKALAMAKPIVEQAHKQNHSISSWEDQQENTPEALPPCLTLPDTLPERVTILATECPLAARHLAQEAQELKMNNFFVTHPLTLIAWSLKL